MAITSLNWTSQKSVGVGSGCNVYNCRTIDGRFSAFFVAHTSLCGSVSPTKRAAFVNSHRLKHKVGHNMAKTTALASGLVPSVPPRSLTLLSSHQIYALNLYHHVPPPPPCHMSAQSALLSRSSPARRLLVAFLLYSFSFRPSPILTSNDQYHHLALSSPY